MPPEDHSPAAPHDPSARRQLSDMVEQLHRMIATDQFVVQATPDEDVYYTIGMTGLGLPELVVQGLCPDDSNVLLRELGNRQIQSAAYEHQQLTQMSQILLLQLTVFADVDKLTALPYVYPTRPVQALEITPFGMDDEVLS